MFDIKKNAQTVVLKNAPRVVGFFSVAGPKEARGKLGESFDIVLDDDTMKEKTYEKTETKMLVEAVNGAIEKASLKQEDINLMLAGDLMNQSTSTGFAARELLLPQLGLYDACATMASSLVVGSLILSGGAMSNCVCVTGSHFSSAERLFRFPLELGNQRQKTSQWTVTGAGAVVLEAKKENVKTKGIKISAVTIGKVIDFGIVDPSNMGAAMAPAAVHTFLTHLKNTKTKTEDYSLIVTGDLGLFGKRIFLELIAKEGININTLDNYNDCGAMVYEDSQGTQQGASGAGASAIVLTSHILKKLQEGIYKKVLFMATGALLSTTTSQQGESIPSVCHAVVLERE
ncbi:MAG: stage V sporulation protein AD [Firmicutes bacterium]|nr:stage V sporulation protein AD [Bacillota bacterium]